VPSWAVHGAYLGIGIVLKFGEMLDEDRSEVLKHDRRPTVTSNSDNDNEGNTKREQSAR